MRERKKKRNDRSEDRRSPEGVRIIRADEAETALDSGQAAGRRPEGELRFGDVPPAPEGPRPPHRFPLPDSADPAAAMPRRPQVGLRRNLADRPVGRRPFRVDPDAAHDPRPWDERVPLPASPVSDDMDPTGEAVVEVTGLERPDEMVTAEGNGPAPAGPPLEHAQDPSFAPGADPRPEAQVADERDPDPYAYEPQTYEPQTYEPQTYEPPASYQPEPAGTGYAASSQGWEPSAAWREWQEPTEVPDHAWPVESEPYAPVVPAADDGTQELSVSEWAHTHQDDIEAAVPEFEGDHMPASRGESDVPSWHDDADEHADLSSPGLSVAPGSTELPHWTDPPTGEVPSVLGDPGELEGDDLKAWRALGGKATRWRGDGDWDEEVDLGDLGSDETRVGAMDQSRSEQSDLYSFDKEFDAVAEERSGAHRALEEERSEAQRAVSIDDFDDFDDFSDLEPQPVVAPGPVSIGSRPTRQPPRPPGTGGGGRTGAASGGGERDLGQAVAVGVGLVVILLVAYAIGSAALLVLATAVVLACAVEAYGMLQRAGFRPATLLGLVASGGVMFAAYWRGEAALPLVAAIMFIASMLWYLLQIVDARPLANVAVTTMTWLWVGLLGSYAALMLRAVNGKGLFLGTVIPVVVADTAAFFTGRQIGHRRLAPHISPGKTVEGLVAGGVAAVITGVIIGKTVTVWGGVGHGLLLGLAVAVLAPMGDLFESMIKRDLSIKDSGSVLPGHGGLLDRFDSILLVLPAAFYLATYFGIVR